MSPATSLSPSWWPAWAWLEEAASLSIVFLRTLLPSATRLLLPAFRSSWLRVLQQYTSSLYSVTFQDLYLRVSAPTSSIFLIFSLL